MKDEVEDPVQVMEEFIRPILTEALAQKAKNSSAKSAEVVEGETLLEHLVNLTDGGDIIRMGDLLLMVSAQIHKLFVTRQSISYWQAAIR